MTDMEERTCPICGKVFIPAPFHVYKDGHGKYYCTWGCFNKYKPRNLRSENHNGGRKRIKIDQFTLDGVFIKTFISINNASEVSGVARSTIRDIIRGRTQPRKYIFKIHNEEVK